MAKVYFSKVMKYEGKIYFPYTHFEVKDSDLESLRKLGAWVVDEGKVVVQNTLVNAVSHAVEKVVEKVAEKVEKPLSEIEQLRQKAESLGIKVKGNWGIPKLTTEIAKLAKK